MAVASVFSIMRAIGVPLGMEDPDHPNICVTIWRSVGDHAARRYYYEPTIQPVVFWVDMAKLDLTEGATPMSVKVDGPKELAGEISGALEPTDPFERMWA